MTLWEFMKDRWGLKKKEIKEMGIDPNQDFDDVTLGELEAMSTELDVTVCELIQY